MPTVKAELDEPNATFFTKLRHLTIDMLTLGTRHTTLPHLKGHIGLSHLTSIVGSRHQTLKRKGGFWHVSVLRGHSRLA